jgi:hypothetical protein
MYSTVQYCTVCKSTVQGARQLCTFKLILANPGVCDLGETVIVNQSALAEDAQDADLALTGLCPARLACAQARARLASSHPRASTNRSLTISTKGVQSKTE